ncbi:MAG: hypothetical protein A2284_16325 [Deltaproteobacteria bacterium RIFOXYA12_FULL_61_11]|nr:MAG: hypothetical protein A2284_16325 [Deltaproteobacteria bacterium RIFOXYA12_FULL_61_11]
MIAFIFSIFLVLVVLQMVLNTAQLVTFKIKVQNIVDLAAMVGAHVRAVYLDSGVADASLIGTVERYAGVAGHMGLGGSQLATVQPSLKSNRLTHINERIMDLFRILVHQTSGVQCSMPGLTPPPFGIAGTNFIHNGTITGYVNCRNVLAMSNAVYAPGTAWRNPELQDLTFERYISNWMFYNSNAAVDPGYYSNILGGNPAVTCCDTNGSNDWDCLTTDPSLPPPRPLPVYQKALLNPWIRGLRFIEQELWGYLTELDQLVSTAWRNIDTAAAASARRMAYSVVASNLRSLRDEEIYVYAEPMYRGIGGAEGIKVECVPFVPFTFIAEGTPTYTCDILTGNMRYIVPYHLYEMGPGMCSTGNTAQTCQDPGVANEAWRLARKYCQEGMIPRRILYDPTVHGTPSVTVGVAHGSTPRGRGLISSERSPAPLEMIERQEVPFTYSNFSSTFGRKWSPAVMAWASAAAYRGSANQGMTQHKDVQHHSPIVQMHLTSALVQPFEVASINLPMRSTSKNDPQNVALVAGMAFPLTAATPSFLPGDPTDFSQGEYFYSQLISRRWPFPWDYVGLDQALVNPLMPGLIPLRADLPHLLGGSVPVLPGTIMDTARYLLNDHAFIAYHGRAATGGGLANPLNDMGGSTTFDTLMKLFRDQVWLNNRPVPAAELKH